MSFIKEVAKFMELGEQEIPSKPSTFFKYEEVDGILDKIKEEVHETDEAVLFHARGDKMTASRIVDGALDTAYVAISLAIKVAGVEGAQRAWDAISNANLSKVDGSLGPVIRDEDGVIKKPKGFKHPNIYKELFGKGK